MKWFVVCPRGYGKTRAHQLQIKEGCEQLSEIPTKARELVRDRQDGQCARCGMPYTELHHRQRRREGGHRVSILVGLCSADHRWAHAHPVEAREAGFIISVAETDPLSAPIKTFAGWATFDDEGNITWVSH